MRVAIAGLYPLDRKRILGGVEAITAVLADGIEKSDEVELHVVTCHPSLDRHRVYREGQRVVHALPLRRLGRLTLHRRDVACLHREFDRIQPDIIHAHGSDIYADAATSSGYPAIVSVHGIMGKEVAFSPGLKERLVRHFDRWYERYVLGHIENLIRVSPYLSDAHPWFHPSHVYDIETSADLRYFSVSGEPEQFRILSPARVIPRKGILELVEAFAILSKQFQQAELRVAGEAETFPAYAGECRRKAELLGVADRVRFLGPLDPDRMAEEYAAAELVVLASGQETAPVAIQEAMAVGRPVVATDVGGNRYMVSEGETGHLVPWGDVRALAGAMGKVLGNWELALAMGRRAREEALQRFHPDSVARRTLEAYRDVISRRRLA